MCSVLTRSQVDDAESALSCSCSNIKTDFIDIIFVYIFLVGFGFKYG